MPVGILLYVLSNGGVKSLETAGVAIDVTEINPRGVNRCYRNMWI